MLDTYLKPKLKDILQELKSNKSEQEKFDSVVWEKINTLPRLNWLEFVGLHIPIPTESYYYYLRNVLLSFAESESSLLIIPGEDRNNPYYSIRIVAENLTELERKEIENMLQINIFSEYPTNDYKLPKKVFFRLCELIISGWLEGTAKRYYEVRLSYLKWYYSSNEPDQQYNRVIVEEIEIEINNITEWKAHPDFSNFKNAYLIYLALWKDRLEYVNTVISKSPPSETIVNSNKVTKRHALFLFMLSEQEPKISLKNENDEFKKSKIFQYAEFFNISGMNLYNILRYETYEDQLLRGDIIINELSGNTTEKAKAIELFSRQTF